MAQLKVHLAKLDALRADGSREDLSPELRAEALFLAAYQAIEAAAARVNVHFGKHQNVRRELEANAEIFGESTEEVWRAFQDIETRLRPKIVYGQNWNKRDLAEMARLFELIESQARARLRT